ncbi:hypothetical protein BGW39_009446 [Mortierella sp. 14UC]|nr:hypothetical protein BGW39_009446 [Mortierella sp. 14UC]
MAIVRRVRIALFLFASLNFILMVAVYSFQAYLSNNPDKYSNEPRIPRLLWQDYIEILCSILFVVVYFYALNGLRFMPTTARVVLLAVPAVLLIYVSIFAMVQTTDKDGGGSAFKCGERDRGGGRHWCGLNWANKFVSALLGFFVLYEIVLTMVWGPMEPRRDYLPRHSDNHQQPIVHDGGQTGSTHAMIQHSQHPAIPVAAVLGGNGAASPAPPRDGYPFPQQPVLLDNIQNTNAAVYPSKAEMVAQERDLAPPPPQVVYQYPPPQQAQFKDQHQQFEVPQPIPMMLPSEPQPASTGEGLPQRQEQEQPHQGASPYAQSQPFGPATSVEPMMQVNNPSSMPQPRTYPA